MSTINVPTLKTGLTVQHPFRRQIHFSTRVLQFVDGTEQRIAQQGQPNREWQIALSKLDEAELSQYSDLFEASLGGTRDIQLLDPIDGQEYVCLFAEPELDVRADALGSGSVEISLLEKK